MKEYSIFYILDCNLLVYFYTAIFIFENNLDKYNYQLLRGIEKRCLISR